ncbi:MAG: hypothetical protein ABI824_06220 [Acidobacteriota bacterium]
MATLPQIAQAPASKAEAHKQHHSPIPAWVPLLLCLPAFIPLLVPAVQAWSRGLVPTVFAQYDLAYYLANGRQHFQDGFHLLYGNPYAQYGTPAIYFQPHVFLLGLLLKLGLSPDAVELLFWITAAAFCSLVAARIYQAWVGWDTLAQKLGFVCFFWGGGCLALLGEAFGLPAGQSVAHSALLFDPSDGWWMLNFGRNLVNPAEAFYHGLFLLAMLLLSQKRFGWALATGALLSISHPFTGLSLALILTAYAALECVLKNGAATIKLLLGSVALTSAHVGYYVFFLHRFADHRAVEEQWTLEWIYLFWTFAPALYLVTILAFGRLTRWKNLATFLADPRMRLCLVWFAVIFALAEHDLVIPPRQPIHFAHGYDWTALFFMAAPAVIPMLEKLLPIRRVPLRVLAVAALMLLFLSDNLLWFGTFLEPGVQTSEIVLTRDEKNVLDWLGMHGQDQAYVASPDRWISYLTPTYTSLRSWSGHDYNTPHSQQRRSEVAQVFALAAAGGTLPTDHPVYYIPARVQTWTPPEGARKVYENQSFVVWLR